MYAVRDYVLTKSSFFCIIKTAVRGSVLTQFSKNIDLFALNCPVRDSVFN
ncbi:hypothetical protein SG0102_15210 [Intestinibaculum porci]|uniref:Uncharacterized protein n=1 Tax=Intestinibaculum porci TaxID=2487118 RepID=A0A3G9J5X0_9FIRM|nr:hypothetical protein SG0102_15210 [Intestinibaculum porci]